MDGLPVPPGISGSLNELFDPSVVNQIDFQTGGWDAEYGRRNAAIVNVQTKVPTGAFTCPVHRVRRRLRQQWTDADIERELRGSSGSSSPAPGKATDLRREPIVADTDAAGQITALHNYANDGQDLFGFAKAAIHRDRSRPAQPRHQSLAVAVRDTVRFGRRRD